MSAANNSTSASDVITYIGVPLAVLGVMPILYNTAVTLVVQSNIRQMLRNSKLEGVTRSDVFNRVIEIEIPRYAIKPCDRLRDREEYWSTSRSPSIIPGGSWMTLNWRKRLIGSRTQRVAYTDQVRQPQAEVAFDDLVSYLLDLGAVPEPEGWKILRSNGLWTPVGWDLMKGPSGQKALSIAPLDDSDGNLSLAIAWSSNWTTRNLDSLPPYWIRLPPPILPLPKYEVAKEGVEGYGDGASTGQENAGELASSRAENSLGQEPEAKGKEVPQPNATTDIVQQQADANSTRAICCHVSSEGLVEAIPQADHAQVFPLPEPLYIDHLKASSTNLGGVWLASALTAYGVSSNTVLWNYKVPKEIVRLASSPLIPCGVLELLGIVDASQTPDWGTPDVSGQRSLERMARRSRDHVQVLAREAQLSPQERMKAQTERMARERQEDFEHFISESAERRRFLDQRRREAFQSPKWAPSLLGDHMLAWLKARHHVPESATVKEATGQSLHGIVLNGAFAKKIFTILELWTDWAANAGMRKEDFDTLQADIESFAWAAVLVAVVSQAGEAVEGRLASDMQECLRMWKYVRLG